MTETVAEYSSTNGHVDLTEHQGILLDIGCGGSTQPGYVGMDVRPLPGVTIVHDVTKFPWPLEDNSVLKAVSSHLVEHLPPFGPDPKLVNLIKLLADRGIISVEDIEEYIGDFEYAPMFVRFMDECWRVMKPGGQLAISGPHAFSAGMAQDPTHCNPINETTWSYFDPFENRANGILWSIYQPRPWKIVNLFWDPSANFEVLMVKRPLEELNNLA